MTADTEAGGNLLRSGTASRCVVRAELLFREDLDSKVLVDIEDEELWRLTTWPLDAAWVVLALHCR